MAKEDLKPIRSTAEAKRKGRKGGIASGIARREKRTLRQCLELLLSMPAPEGHEGGDTSEAVSAALIKKALKGDVSAFAVLRDSVGEKPTDKMTAEHSGPGGGPILVEHDVTPEIAEFLTRLKGE